jgi:hypothetical protein
MANPKALPFQLVRVWVTTESGVCQSREVRRSWTAFRRPLEHASREPAFEAALPTRASVRRPAAAVHRPDPGGDFSSNGQGWPEPLPQACHSPAGDPRWADPEWAATPPPTQQPENQDQGQGQDDQEQEQEQEQEDPHQLQLLTEPTGHHVGGTAARTPTSAPALGASVASQGQAVREAQVMARAVAPLAAVTRAVEEVSLVRQLADWLVRTCNDEVCRDTGPWEFTMPLRPFGLGESCVDLHLSPALLSLRFRCEGSQVSRLLSRHRDRLLANLRERLPAQSEIELTVVDA